MEGSSLTSAFGGAHAGRPFGSQVRIALSSTAAAGLGLLPHVLHHVGPFAGAALFAGASGSVLFGAIGFAAAIPFLVRLRRRHEGWRVPLAVLAAMTVVFTLSTVFVGPAITGDGSEAASFAPDAVNHDAHH